MASHAVNRVRSVPSKRKLGQTNGEADGGTESTASDKGGIEEEDGSDEECGEETWAEWIRRATGTAENLVACKSIRLAEESRWPKTCSCAIHWKRYLLQNAGRRIAFATAV